mgnify:CR=1 FL=1
MRTAVWHLCPWWVFVVICRKGPIMTWNVLLCKVKTQLEMSLATRLLGKLMKRQVWNRKNVWITLHTFPELVFVVVCREETMRIQQILVLLVKTQLEMPVDTQTYHHTIANPRPQSIERSFVRSKISRRSEASRQSLVYIHIYIYIYNIYVCSIYISVYIYIYTYI